MNNSVRQPAAADAYQLPKHLAQLEPRDYTDPSKPHFRWNESISGGFWISYDFDYPCIL
jgi:hypothetical protein